MASLDGANDFALVGLARVSIASSAVRRPISSYNIAGSKARVLTSISQDAFSGNESRINESTIGRLASSTSSHLSAKSREGATAKARKHVNAAFPRAFARIPGIWLIGNAKVRDYGVFGRPARIHGPTRDEVKPHVARTSIDAFLQTSNTDEFPSRSNESGQKDKRFSSFARLILHRGTRLLLERVNASSVTRENAGGKRRTDTSSADD